MVFGSHEWYVDTANTIAALCAEVNAPVTAKLASELFYRARELRENDVAMRAYMRTLAPVVTPPPPIVLVKRAPLPPFPPQPTMTIPGYRPLPDILTGTPAEAVAYLNGLRHELGLADLTQDELARYAALVDFHPTDPLVTGTQVNRIVAEMTKPGKPYDRVLPWTPPKHRDFLRADVWGVPVPGLPFVPRGSSEHPERFLTYLDYKYSRVWLQRGLDAHAARGYTHWVRSWPDARSDGGQSHKQFVDDCLFIKQTIPYVHVKLASKDFDPRDYSPSQWVHRVDPIMDALISADAVDEFGVWEWDSFNVPGWQTTDALKHMGQIAHAGGCSFWLHFYPEHTSWFADKGPRGRFGFYDDLGSDVDGLDYQAVSTWSVGELQARMVDTLVQFANQGHGHKLRLFERGAELSFSHDHPNEDEENLMGFLACCTKAPATVWGYGNGARMPDGSVL